MRSVSFTKVSLVGALGLIAGLYVYPRSDFIGRASELEKLREYRKTKGSPVLISGQYGVGKTRLVEEFLQTAGFTEIVRIDGSTPDGKVKGLQQFNEILTKYGQRPWSEFRGNAYSVPPNLCLVVENPINEMEFLFIGPEMTIMTTREWKHHTHLHTIHLHPWDEEETNEFLTRKNVDPETRKLLFEKIGGNPYGLELAVNGTPVDNVISKMYQDHLSGVIQPMTDVHRSVLKVFRDLPLDETAWDIPTELVPSEIRQSMMFSHFIGSILRPKELGVFVMDPWVRNGLKMHLR